LNASSLAAEEFKMLFYLELSYTKPDDSTMAYFLTDAAK